MTMAVSSKPVIWSLFAAGGTYAALILPVLIFISGFAIVSGLLPAEALAYERVLGVAQNPLGKLVLFVTIFLPIWHAAHRLRITAHDFGLRADGIVKTVCYGLAALGTLVAIIALFSL
jgi:succinate dehydrogenase subunit D